MLKAETLPSECPIHMMLDRWSVKVQVTGPASFTPTCIMVVACSTMGMTLLQNQHSKSNALQGQLRMYIFSWQHCTIRAIK